MATFLLEKTIAFGRTTIEPLSTVYSKYPALGSGHVFTPFFRQKASLDIKKAIHPLHTFHSRRMDHCVEHDFIRLLEKVHRPSKYPETLRLQVAGKVFPGIPFFNKRE